MLPITNLVKIVMIIIEDKVEVFRALASAPPENLEELCKGISFVGVKTGEKCPLSQVNSVPLLLNPIINPINK